jgi:enoyl-CoA hydratase
LNKPVVAAVAGYACAGGLGVSLWCDLRVVEETAKFAVLSRRWGVPMSDGTTVRLPRLIGMSNALDMLLTARSVSAGEALQMGLANRVVPHGAAREQAEALAAQMAEFPQIAMRSDRESAYRQDALTLSDALAREEELAQDAKRIEAQAGAARFAEGAGRHGVMPEGRRADGESA